MRRHRDGENKCTSRKVIYGSTGTARRGIERLVERLQAQNKYDHEWDSTLAPFYCKLCDGWHIGHSRSRDSINQPTTQHVRTTS